MDKLTSHVSVIGLGKLGASMAAALGQRGFNVIGVDVNQNNVDAINQGHAPVQETGLEEMINANKKRIKATTSHREAVLCSDISFVIVPTPSDARGAFSLQYAAWVFKEIGQALREKQGYHLIVLTSTVLPGSCRYGLIPVLERASGKRCGEDFGFCYSPEFIALGSVIKDFLNPDFTLIGEFDQKSGDMLQACYSQVVENGAGSQRMSIENAELAKVALNSYVTMKITFANVIAEICERLPGGNVDVVTKAIGNDERIGKQYLTGGLGFGGPCFPRDNVALNFMTDMLGTDGRLFTVTREVNNQLASKISARLKEYCVRSASVAVLGLAYKPFTHVVEESQGVMIANELTKAGARVLAYDPLARESASGKLYGNVILTNSVEHALQQAQAVVICTPDPEFMTITPKMLRLGNDPILMLDCWRLLEEKFSKCSGVKYEALGCADVDLDTESKLQELWGSTAEHLFHNV